MKLKSVFLLLLALAFYNSALAQCISSFPYYEDFESDNGGWTPGGTASEWSWGTPLKPVIHSAYSGNKCWITGTLTQSSYSNNQNSTLTSPCFDLSGLTSPFISFYLFWETEKKYDGASFQYSTDGGNTWHTLGSNADYQNCPENNWYNTTNITTLGSDGWSGNIQSTSSCAGGAGNGSGQWKKVQRSVPMLAGLSNVQFRFRFAAGSVCNNYDGFAVDDFRIGNADPSAMDFSFSCISGNTVSFQPSGSFCNAQYQWDFGDPASGTSNTSSLVNPTHSFSGAGVYTISLSLANAPNPQPVTKQVTILEINTQTLVPIKCYGDKATLEAWVVPTGNYQYSWNTVPVQNGPIVSHLPAGSYTLSVSGSNACPATDQIILTQPGPVAVDLGRDTVICSGQQLLLDAGSFFTYEWQDGSPDRYFPVSKSGRYVVTVADANGCEAMDSILVTVDCSDIYFPSAFTPDGNGRNDFFGALGNLSGVRNYSLKIFNRWGELVFFTRDPRIKWNGFAHDQSAAASTFVWVAEYQAVTTGLKRRQKGTITLIR